jgi:hypothetical protein
MTVGLYPIQLLLAINSCSLLQIQIFSGVLKPNFFNHTINSVWLCGISALDVHL